MTSLVDRYVTTALRRVPDGQRADIDRELRASIEDAVDARMRSGEPHEAAVERTLVELGDPDRLADRYADRPGHLIGPELYPAWRRLMTVLFSVVLPVVVGIAVVVQVVDDPGVGQVVGAIVSTLLNVGVHLAFWTTAVFVVIERTGAGRAELRTTWSLDDLPAYDPDRRNLTQMAAGVVWPVILIVALVLQQVAVADEPVLDPANWSFWWPYLVAVLALEVAYAVWVYRRGVVDRAAAAVNAVLSLLAAVPLVWLLAADRFFNPAFPPFAGTGSSEPRWLAWVTALSIAAVVLSTAWDIVDVARRVEWGRPGVPARVSGTGGSSTRP